MLQVYSSALTQAADAVFPFNNVVIDKGCGETLSAPASVQLNQRGIYLVEVDGFGTGAAAATGSAQLYVNGVVQPQAISTYGAAAGTVSNFGFKTFVQVVENNCKCNTLSSPTVLQVMNGDAALTDAHINMVVTKIK